MKNTRHQEPYKIYKITCLKNNMIYIGRTGLSLDLRWKNHIFIMNNPKFSQKPLYAAMRRFGVSNFRIEILEQYSKSNCFYDGAREKFWMYINNSIHPNGYNVQVIGESNMPYIKSRIARKKKK